MIIFLDFETTGLDVWAQDFRVLTAGLDVDGVEEFYLGEETIGPRLRELAENADAVWVAHNAQFELACLIQRFGISPVNLIDTMRLAQMFDNGGQKAVKMQNALAELIAIEEGEDVTPPPTGLGLVACTKRILEEADYKAPYYAWLRDNLGVPKGSEGANLYQLPGDMLRDYNMEDVRVTKRLYTHCTEALVAADWRGDHALYMSTVRLTVEAFLRGIHVDRDALIAYDLVLMQEIEQMELAFLAQHEVVLQRIVRRKADEWVSEPKTDKGRDKRRAKIADGTYTGHMFNVGSNAQLELLFVTHLGMTPTFMTKKGKPSFRGNHLGQWGESGQLLKMRRKRAMVLSQTRAALALSAKDGRWHANTRVCGTRTGRGVNG